MLKGQRFAVSLVAKICAVCGAAFVAPSRPANRRRCSDCRPSQLPSRRATLARYAKTSKRAAVLKRYNASPKARATARRYRATVKGADTRRLYQRTARGRASRRAAWVRYKFSPAGVEALRAKRKRQSARRWRERNPAMMRAQARYRKSEKGRLRACMYAWRQRYGAELARELEPFLFAARLLRREIAQ